MSDEFQIPAAQQVILVAVMENVFSSDDDLTKDTRSLTPPMTVTLDIRPEVQGELARQAALQGRAIESVATALLGGGRAAHIRGAASRGAGRQSGRTPEPV